RGRGLMEREVVRVITPGTILEEESLEPGAPSLLAALAAEGDRFGIAAIDFATGAFRASEVRGWELVRDELERLAPRELLLAPDLPPAVEAACREGRPWATALLPEPAPVEGELPRLAARAAGGALAYVDASYRRRPAHLRPPETYAPAGFLQLDAATRRNLELLQTLGGERRGSLLWVLDRTATPMGARRVREWLLYPLLEPAAIGRRLDAVEELAERVELREALRAAPPPHTRLPGFIRPGRDREVDELRETARDARGWLARFEASERQRTGIASLKVRHNKVFGYYVEVTRPNLPLVPPDYERRQTLVGAER